jgi:hypothetical protein
VSALTPAFASATIAYTISVPNGTTSITLTPTVADATATVKVNTVTVASGSPSSPIALAVGSNVITTVVTAQDGTTTKTYTVTVTRAASNVTTLSNLSGKCRSAVAVIYRFNDFLHGFGPERDYIDYGDANANR